MAGIDAKVIRVSTMKGPYHSKIIIYKEEKHNYNERDLCKLKTKMHIVLKISSSATDMCLTLEPTMS